ncbi:MAG: 30S ribosome-binding factor RbfA [Prevotellaceae bacterium]|nr:30S ribosome-binding factor RbfA [Prevotellaceae bacterium]
MATTRQLKVGRQLQKDIGEIIQRQGMAAYGGALVTVMGVEVSPDLGFARVVLSIFPSEKAVEARALLNEKRIRTELARRVKHQLRVVPELAFAVDVSLDYVERIEQLLKEATHGSSAAGSAPEC